jgi:hypothetical protein
VASHKPYEKALGIKTVALSNNGRYLGVGSFDQTVISVTA